MEKTLVVVDLENVSLGHNNRIHRLNSDRRRLGANPGYFEIDLYELETLYQRFNQPATKLVFASAWIERLPPREKIVKLANRFQQQGYQLELAQPLRPIAPNVFDSEAYDVDSLILQQGLDLLYDHDEYSTIIIVSDDADLLQLAEKALELGKRAIFIESFMTSSRIRQYVGNGNVITMPLKEYPWQPRANRPVYMKN